MASRRDQIRMSDQEIAAFLDEQRVVVAATYGPRGWPHVMPLWYVVGDAELWAWTFGKSQKVRNLQRDPRATLLVEAGEDDYFQLRGVQMECDVRIHADDETTASTGREIMRRYTGSDEGWEGMRSQVPKRVALQFLARKTVSWDHRKLGDTY